MIKTLKALATGVLMTLVAGFSQAAEKVDYLSFATEDETNTTEVFSGASPSVVYVTSTALRRQMLSLIHI